MSRSFHVNTKNITNIIRKYGKNGPFPEKVLKTLERFRLKGKTKKEVLAKRKAKKLSY